MITRRLLHRARQVVAFARYIPINKLVGRVTLSIRRKLRDRLAWIQVTTANVPQRTGAPPLPVFAPRKRLSPVASGDGWRFTFLNRSVEMAGPRIDWMAPGIDSAHQLWRMNLHYMEYLEGVTDAQVEALIRDWIESNPVGAPRSWRDSWSSYSVSLRTVVWMQELTRRAGHLPSELAAQADASLAQQLGFLEHNLETDIGGNHLVKNIKALIWASAYFAGAEAERWRKTGLDLLTRELRIQILSDGMHYERSASYHAQVFSDLLECRHALGHDPLNGQLDDSLHRMAQVMADLAHPDGGPVLFNDSGLTMAYQTGECLDVYERLLGRRPVPRALPVLRDAGYFGMRAAEAYFVADCGRIAPDDLPAHGHGDVLSFEWSVAGKRIIVDQGVYEYDAGERRQRARAASSHNTLSFEGADQADFFGAFRCGRRPGVEVRDYKSLADGGFVLEGTHDGFHTLPGRPRHIRRFEVQPVQVVIEDRVEGDPHHPAYAMFLLHPSVSVEGEGRKIELRRGRTVISMTSTVSIDSEPAIWWPDMGYELPTWRLVLRLAPGTVHARTEFRIWGSMTGVPAHP
jgi:uncharacterized heparinase superfamily protein